MARLYSKGAGPFSVLPSTECGFQFLHILTTGWLSDFFYSSHLSVCEVVSHCGFNFLMTLSIISHGYWPLYIFLEKWLFGKFAHFYLVILFVYWVIKVLYESYKVSYQLCGLQVFSPIIWSFSFKKVFFIDSGLDTQNF